MRTIIRLAMISMFALQLGARWAHAENKELTNNLSFKPSSVGLAMTGHFISVRDTWKDKMAVLSFNYEVSSPRDQASGQASGKRMHGSISAQPINSSLIDRIASLILSGDVKEAQRNLKIYLVSLSHVHHPVDVNAEIFAILDKAFLRKDPELRIRLDAFADDVGSLEANRVQTLQLQTQLGNCRSIDPQSDLTLNLCDSSLLQELKGKIDSLTQEASSLKEKATQDQLRLQEAIDRREAMMQALSDILQKLEETADGVIQNMK